MRCEAVGRVDGMGRSESVPLNWEKISDSKRGQGHMIALIEKAQLSFILHRVVISRDVTSQVTKMKNLHRLKEV